MQKCLRLSNRRSRSGGGPSLSQGPFHAEKVALLVGQRIGAAITAPIDPDAMSSGVLELVLAALPQEPSIPDGRDLSFEGPSLNSFDPMGWGTIPSASCL